MFRALSANLILHERIRTTEAKAKELRRVVERLITKGVRLGAVATSTAADLSAEDVARRVATKRVIGKFLQPVGTRETEEGEAVEVDLVEKVVTELAKRYQGRPGGYTRIVKLGRRRGDNAPMCFIELVGESADEAGAPEAGAPKAEAEPAAAEPAEAGP